MKDNQGNKEKIIAKVEEILAHAFEEVMDIDQLCSFLPLDKPSVYALTSRRLIPHSKPTGKLMFRKSKILKWLDDHEIETEVDIKKKILNQ